MTYLEAINKVLRRLREDEAASPTDTAYTKLIGEFVNDANNIVENSWDWSQLRRKVNIDTVAGQRYYPLEGLNFNYTTQQVINQTGKEVLDLATQAKFVTDIFITDDPDNATQGEIQYYANTGFDVSDTVPEIAFYPIPDAVYKIRVQVVDRSDELTASTDVIKVPSLPVIQLAHAMATEERGELGSTSASRLYQLAQSTLSDAIAQDAARFPLETVWSDV